MRDACLDTRYCWITQACPICGDLPTRRLGRRGGAAHRLGLGVECVIWMCESCNLLFPNPMPVPIGGCDQHYQAVDDYFVQHDVLHKERGGAALLRQAQKFLGQCEGLRVLDVGCGRGELLRAAVHSGWQAVGIEPSAEFAAFAAQHSGADVRTQVLEECRFDSSSFDVVVMAAVLEHMYDPDQAMREVGRIARPGGVLYVDVPNESGPLFRAANLRNRLLRRDWVVNLSPTFSPFHVFGFSPRALTKLLAKHGLNIVHSRQYLSHCQVGAVGIRPVEELAVRCVDRLGSWVGSASGIEVWAARR